MSTTSGDHVTPRQFVFLEAGQHDRFLSMTRQRGHTGTHLVGCWLERAVAEAETGLPLPPAVPEPKVRGAGRDWKKVAWKQSDTEHEHWCTVLRAAGSSPTAVVRARVQRYLEANGDRVAASKAPLVAA